jgi:UDP-N-acetylglucosamine acyltransferase
MMIHPTAQVHPDAQIDPTVEIGPWCTVGPHVKLGSRTRLISHVVMAGWTKVGEDNVFYPFSVIGAIPQDLKYKGEPTQLVIGNKNTIRECATLNLGTVQGGGVTKIGNDTLIMAYTHLGHDCIVGDGCIIANYGGLAGHVTLEDYVTIGGMCGISQYVRVGTHSYVAGQSGLERDVPPFSIVMGSRPTILKGANIVGLKRRGFAIETIQKINEGIKMWAQSHVQKEQCLLEIESHFEETPEIKEFVSFIRKSEIGVVR